MHYRKPFSIGSLNEDADTALLKPVTLGRELCMGTVVIRCPVTGKVVPVGFEAVRDTFHASENAMATIRCRSCGQLHRWEKRDVWVEPIDKVRPSSIDEMPHPSTPTERRSRPRP
jgi:hypothetical protein